MAAAQCSDLRAGAFSKSLGIKSVREYEDKILREAKEQEQHLQELKTQQAKLRSQLQFEKTKVILFTSALSPSRATA